jgi:hypothetical protein
VVAERAAVENPEPWKPEGKVVEFSGGRGGGDRVADEAKFLESGEASGPGAEVAAGSDVIVAKVQPPQVRQADRQLVDLANVRDGVGGQRHSFEAVVCVLPERTKLASVK